MRIINREWDQNFYFNFLFFKLELYKKVAETNWKLFYMFITRYLR